MVSVLFVTVVITGVAFMTFVTKLTVVLENPTGVFNLSGVAFNAQEHNPDRWEPTDPNWDGALAGWGVGSAYGIFIPVIGPVAGPMLGAAIGYNLDSEL